MSIEKRLIPFSRFHIGNLLLMCLLGAISACGGGGGSSGGDSTPAASQSTAASTPARSSVAASSLVASSMAASQSSAAGGIGIAQIYQTNCAGCHGAQGQGGVGPAFLGFNDARVKAGVARMPSGGVKLSCGTLTDTQCRDQLSAYVLANFTSTVMSSSSQASTTSSKANSSITSMASSSSNSIASSNNSNASSKSSASKSSASSSTATLTIAAIFQSQCAGCHGVDAKGGSGPALTGTYTVDYLKSAVARMPAGAPTTLNCGALALTSCRDQLAQYIFDVFAKKQTAIDLTNVYYAKARVRRLTPSEYFETLKSLGATNPQSTLSLPVDTKVNGYSTKSDQLFYNTLFAQELWDKLSVVADEINTQIYNAATCSGAKTTWGATCARSLLQTLTTKAYRRAPTTTELDDLVAVYTAARGSDTFQVGLKAAVQTVLQSPDLIYRTELGGGATTAATITMTNEEIASAISYLITASPPDSQLLAAVSTLADSTARATQATRLLATAKAKSVLGNFAAEWLYSENLFKVNPDPTTFPQWLNLRTSIANEPGAFFSRAVIDENMTFKQLLTANWTVGATDLKDFYGATVSGDKLMLPATRSGILTQAALMASFASPIDPSPVRRGKFIRTRILCQAQLPPPDNLIPSPPDPDPTLTNRERWTKRQSATACADCHSRMNPIGFSFENYDSIGKYRATDANKSVDATGYLLLTDVDGYFNNAVELTQKLSQSAEAHQCFSRNYLEYSLGTSADDSVYLALNELPSFVAQSASIKELIVAFVKSPRFIVRNK